ncbi:MAG: T9SS type A sorting domain-containing protein [Bacteroidota bacterium]
MKKCLWYLLLCWPLFGWGNIVENGSFEVVVGNCSFNNGTYFGAFTNNCLGDGWNCYSKYPTVVTNTAPGAGTAADGAHFAKMTASNAGVSDRSAIYYSDLKVCEGLRYDISFSVRAGSEGLVGYKVVAIDFLPNNCTFGFVDPTTDPLATIITQGTLDPSQGWVDVVLTDVSLDLPINTGGNDVQSELLIYPVYEEETNPNTNRTLYFDNLVIVQQTAFFCNEIIDDKACVELSNFGSIRVECDEPGTFDGEVILPGGAFILVGEGFIEFFAVFPGDYIVTFTSEAGCVATKTYTVEDICPCDPPNLQYCAINSQTGQSSLNWDDPEQTGLFNLELFPNDPSCPCWDGSPTSAEPLLFENVAGTSFDMSGFREPCFAWRVQSICGDKVSEWSALDCFGAGSECIVFKTPQTPTTKGATIGQTQSKVYPNPSLGALTIEVETNTATAFTLELFSLEGKRVRSERVDHLSGALYRDTWRLDDQLENGIYFLHITSEAGTVQHKIILSR